MIAALSAAIWAIITYFLTRQRELSWKRTEFIVEQSAYLDNDAEMRECTLILYGKHPTLSVDDFLNAEITQSIDDPTLSQLVIKFEKYLNFIWRIAYAHLILGTLTKKDLLAFGVYLLAIQYNDGLREYCLNKGYEEIVTAAAKIEN